MQLSFKYYFIQIDCETIQFNINDFNDAPNNVIMILGHWCYKQTSSQYKISNHPWGYDSYEERLFSCGTIAQLSWSCRRDTDTYPCPAEQGRHLRV